MRPDGRLRTARVAGHFGELLQGRVGPDLALFTLPCPILGVTATWHPAGPFALHQNRPALTPAQVRALFAAAGHPRPFGRLKLRIDMPLGAGVGASTAALLAVARTLGLPPEAEAQTCLSLEGATDPLMHAEPCLWAPRAARALRPLPPLPAMEVVGGILGTCQRTDPSDTDFAPIDDLLGTWTQGDLPTLARLATTSAERNVAHRGGDLTALRAAAEATDALGFCIAHTGAAQALLFAPGTAPANLRIGSQPAPIHYRLRAA